LSGPDATLNRKIRDLERMLTVITKRQEVLIREALEERDQAKRRAAIKEAKRLQGSWFSNSMRLVSYKHDEILSGLASLMVRDGWYEETLREVIEEEVKREEGREGREESALAFEELSLFTDEVTDMEQDL